MAYEVLAMDMDGTVLSSEKRITQRTQAAIHAAIRAGKTVLFATGRSPIEMREYLSLFPEMEYVMYLSGALVRQKEKSLHAVHISPNVVENLVEIGQNCGGMMVFYTENAVYTGKQWRGRMGEYGCECFQELYDQQASWVEDVYGEALQKKNKIFKCNIFFPDEASWQTWKPHVEALPVTVSSGIPNNLEISPQGVDKGSGLKILSEHLGLELSQVIAVGDQGNDISMLSVAGLGVAMGNATEEVKSIAGAITADCDHDGVADVIATYLLEDKETP